MAKDALYPLDMDRALTKIKSIKDDSIYWGSAFEAHSMVVNGEVSMPMLFQNRARNIEKDTDGRYKLVMNEAIAMPSAYIVPKGNPAGREAVMKLIANAQSVPAQLSLFECLGMTPSNPEAFAQVPEDEQFYAITSAQNIDNIIYNDPTWWGENGSDVVNAFLGAISCYARHAGHTVLRGLRIYSVARRCRPAEQAGARPRPASSISCYKFAEVFFASSLTKWRRPPTRWCLLPVGKYAGRRIQSIRRAAGGRGRAAIAARFVGHRLRCDRTRFVTDHAVVSSPSSFVLGDNADGGAGDVPMVRPENIRIQPETMTSGLPVTICDVTFPGAFQLISARTNWDEQLSIRAPLHSGVYRAVKAGDAVWLTWENAGITCSYSLVRSLPAFS